MLIPTSVLLNDLLRSLGRSPLEGEVVVEKIAFDSRQCYAGTLFVAIPCSHVRQHIVQAIERGAIAIVAEPTLCEEFTKNYPQHLFIDHTNPRLGLAHLAAAYYPEQPAVNVAVTGTNGKSSVVSFVRQLWQHLGFSAATMGTLGLDVGTRSGMLAALKIPSLTTPDALSLHQALHLFSQNGITHCAFEASSHGLDQCRLHGVKLAAAAWTNLTQDHLDYHQSLDRYFTAKLRLVDEVLPVGRSLVVNVDTNYYPELVSHAQARSQPILSYGIEKKALFEARDLSLTTHSTHFTLWIDGKNWGKQTLSMAGVFQVSNLLCALGLLQATGSDVASLLPFLPKLVNVKGRMDLIGTTRKGGHVFVDYAHTPDALQQALQSLRIHTQGKLWVVFGCGGNRDQEKRPRMGSIAAELADIVIVTDDNPRNEDAALIRQHIRAACSQSKEIGDRREAIAYAMSQLDKGDVLLVAGKGHEQGQILEDQVLAFDDRTEILSNLQNIHNIREV